MRAVILGATGGIGGAVAERLARAGAALVLGGRDDARLRERAASLGATAVPGDATDPAYADALDAVLGEGALDAFVYAVGTINLKPLARLGDEDFRRDFEVNALAPARLLRRLAPRLKASGQGSVVLFSSVAVGQGFAAHASISMAKGAVEGLTRALAAEFAPAIRVNCVAPSLTRTGLAAGLTGNPTMAKAIADLHALPRLGEAEDAAALAAFLAGPESGWITGQVMAVDGGRSRVRTKG